MRLGGLLVTLASLVVDDIARLSDGGLDARHRVDLDAAPAVALVLRVECAALAAQQGAPAWACLHALLGRVRVAMLQAACGGGALAERVVAAAPFPRPCQVRTALAEDALDTGVALDGLAADAIDAHAAEACAEDARANAPGR